MARIAFDEHDPSLAGGHAGLALFYATLAHLGDDRDAAVRARRCLDIGIGGLSNSVLDSSLFGGFTGIALAVHQVDNLLDPEAGDRVDPIDEVLSQLMSRRRRWIAPHDLVLGVTGLGVYALERLPRPAAFDCLVRVVACLRDTAHHDDDGTYWWTPAEGMLSEEAQAGYPDGRADLGVAHGLAGVVALLGGICAAGVERITARSLLDGAVHWLLAHAVPTAAGPTVPVWVAPGEQPEPTRTAWCYGDPGVAAALLLAARGAGERDWEREAVALACRAAARDPADTGVVDASFCHGAAGLAHIYNRLYQATGEPRLAAAARSWVDRTVAFCRAARTSDPAWVLGTTEPRRGPWTGLDVVDGAAGVGLALSATVAAPEPAWDRMFLLSAPGVPGPMPG